MICLTRRVVLRSLTRSAVDHGPKAFACAVGCRQRWYQQPLKSTKAEIEKTLETALDQLRL
jgi:hypothetical protein